MRAREVERLLATLALLCASGAAKATTCTVSSSGMAFGVYSPAGGSPNLSSGLVTVNCLFQLGLLGSSVSYTTALGPGLSPSGTGFTRRMRFGSGALQYQLYADPARSQVWGDGTGGSVTVPGSCTFLVLNLACTSNQTIYGAMPAGQWGPPGAYLDTVTVTISY